MFKFKQNASSFHVCTQHLRLSGLAGVVIFAAPEDPKRSRHLAAVKMASQTDLLMRHLKVAQMRVEIIAKEDQRKRGELRDAKPHAGFIC